MENKKQSFITAEDFNIAAHDLFIKYFPESVFVKYASFVTGDDISKLPHYITRNDERAVLNVLPSRSLGDAKVGCSQFVSTNDYMEYSSKTSKTTRVNDWIRDFLDQAIKASEEDLTNE